MAWNLYHSETVAKTPTPRGFFALKRNTLLTEQLEWLVVEWIAEDVGDNWALKVKDYKTNVDIPINQEVGSNSDWQWTWFNAVMSGLPWHEWCELH